MEKRNKKNIILYGIFTIMIFIPIIYSKITIDIFELQKFVLSSFIFITILIFFYLKCGLYKPEKNLIFWFLVITMLILVIVASGIYNNKHELIPKYLFYWLNILCVSFVINNIFQELGSDYHLNISKIIIIPSIIISIIGIFQLLGINLIVEISSSRPGSFMNIRNFVSDYLLITLPFILFLFLNSTKIIEIIIYAFSLLFTIFYMFAIRSRVAFLIIIFYLFILILSIFFIKQFQNKKLLFLTRTFVFLIIVLISFFLSKFEFPYTDPERKKVETILESFSEIKYPPNISRLFYYDASLNIFKDNPLLGIGPGTWAGFFGKYHWDEFNDRTTYNNSAIYAHNDFLEYLSETGLFGFTAYCFIFLFPFIKLFKKNKTEIKYFPFLLSILGFIIMSLFAFPKENINVMFIILICIIASFDYHNTKRNIPFFFNIAIITISLLVLTFNFLRVSSEREYISAINFKANNQYHEMIQSIEKINNYIYPLDPNKIPITYYLGVGYYEIKNYEKAYECFEEALKLMPYFPQIINNKAITLYTMGETEKSENLLLETKRNFPYYYEPQINLLVLYMKEKKYDEAEKLIDEIENKETGQKYKYAKNINTFFMIKKNLNEIKNK